MIPVNNEHYEFKLYKRLKNSPYEYESVPTAIFSGRPANRQEIKLYRVQKGVNGNNESIFVYCTNLPEIVKPGDHIEFFGSIKTVLSIGYYYDASLFINPKCMSTDQIIARCPKGINLE